WRAPTRSRSWGGRRTVGLEDHCELVTAERPFGEDVDLHEAILAILGHAASLPRGCVEGAAQVAQRRLSDVERDLHDVEPNANVTQPVRFQVELREHDETALLVPRDRGGRTGVPSGSPSLYFNEHPHVAVATHEVDLAAAEAHVALDHAQSCRFEGAGCALV